VITADINIEKIDHITEPDPIDKVADGAAGNQGQGQEYTALSSVAALGDESAPGPRRRRTKNTCRHRAGWPASMLKAAPLLVR
jgi:hypothetical protein